MALLAHKAQGLVEAVNKQMFTIQPLDEYMKGMVTAFSRAGRFLFSFDGFYQLQPSLQTSTIRHCKLPPVLPLFVQG